MAAVLATIINKNDARSIAEVLRVGHYKECVHRSDEAVEIRTLLHERRTAVRWIEDTLIKHPDFA